MNYEDLTPWGSIQDSCRLGDGVVRVSTASHGGLMLISERWAELPESFRAVAWEPRAPYWKGKDKDLQLFFAEEDCEEVIVLTLLGLANSPIVLDCYNCDPGIIRQSAIDVARTTERYSVVLQYLESK